MLLTLFISCRVSRHVVSESHLHINLILFIMNLFIKAVNIFWLVLASILLAMSISGILFISYHIFIQGVTINFGIY